MKILFFNPFKDLKSTHFMFHYAQEANIKVINVDNNNATVFSVLSGEIRHYVNELVAEYECTVLIYS